MLVFGVLSALVGCSALSLSLFLGSGLALFFYGEICFLGTSYMLRVLFSIDFYFN